MLVVLQSIALWISAIGCIAIGGIYFAFSTFIMTAFASVDRHVGMTAMRAINEVILQSLFMPLFFGTTIASIALVGFAVLDWNAPSARLIFSAALVFVAGMFLVTAIANVPWNNELVARLPDSAGASEFWSEFLQRWVFWNHVRTVASLCAGAMFVVALVRA